MSFSQFLGKLICHGQYLCIYPAAFESSTERLRDIESTGDVSPEIIELTASDGIKLSCYFLHAQRPQTDIEPQNEGRETSPAFPRATVIMFHGNGYHIWHQVHFGQEFAKLGCNVLMVSYRGYGASQGKPSEKGLRKDAQAALDYVLSRDDLSQTRIILQGHSLGGAVAIDLIFRNPNKISAVILENTFLSIPAVAKGLPFIKPITWIIHQKWDSVSKISSIPRTTPLLMISGARDDVVPPAHMSILWNIAQGRGVLTERKHKNEQDAKEKGKESVPLKDVFVTIDDGDHADTWCKAGYWPSVDAFLRSLA